MKPSHPPLTSVRPSSPAFWLNIVSFIVVGAMVSVIRQEPSVDCIDYPFHFNNCLMGMAMGAVFGVVFNLLHGKIPYAANLQPLLVIFLRYYLAWIMLAYGGGKVIPLQFPHWAADMESTFGELSPNRVAWAFFGYSKGYQMFLGWAETIPSLLLLFRRTYLLGAFVMVTVLVNVVAVNLFFDVCVKVNSSIYLTTALFLVVNEYRRVLPLFFTGRAAPSASNGKLFQHKTANLVLNILKGLAVAYVLGSTACHYWNGYQYYQKQHLKTPVAGAWRVEKMERWQGGGTWVDVPPTDSTSLNRIYFEGLFGVFKGPGNRDRLYYDIDSTKQEMNITFIAHKNAFRLEKHWQYHFPDSLHLSMIGKWWDDSVRVECALRKEVKVH